MNPVRSENITAMELEVGKVLHAARRKLATVAVSESVTHRLDLACQIAEPSLAAATDCAGALAAAGCLNEAEMIFHTLSTCAPNVPAGFVGLSRIAMQRQAWVQALARWDDVGARFGGDANGVWEAARARCLTELDCLNEADKIYERLRHEMPDRPAGLVGLAEAAARSHLWSRALTLWEQVLNRFPDHPDNPAWQAGRASVLISFGRCDEAEATFRRLLALQPKSPHALLGLLRVLLLSGQAQQALQELDSSGFRFLETRAIFDKRLDILIKLRRMSDARAEFQRVLARTEDCALFESLFNFTPRLYEGWERTRTWLALLGRLDAASTSQRAAAAGLRLRLLLALRDYEQFLLTMGSVPEPLVLGIHRRALQAVAATLRESFFPDYGKPKIFGIGLSKTGTTTLARALGDLGLQVLDWLNPLTRELLSDDDLYLFDAFTDTPVAASFEKLYYRFSEAKFIYTTRPLEDWRRSMVGHWSRNFGCSDFEQARTLMAHRDSFPYGRAFSDLHMSLYYNHRSYEEAWRSYDRRVRTFFRDKPQDRFLEFNVFAGHGWAELCNFLGYPVPDHAFPWENRAPSQSPVTP